MMSKRASRNRTLVCSDTEIGYLSDKIFQLQGKVRVSDISDRIIEGDTLSLAENFPEKFVDLIILDPPYNLSKDYNGHLFRKKEKSRYQKWFQNIIEVLLPTLRPHATIYTCSDWTTSVLIAPILESYFYIRNRITWEREKGRGAKVNWKNNLEDIWFCTVSDKYYFNADAVKLKRKVIAPYKVNGKPKDWNVEGDGNYRLTYPSNI